MAAPDSGLDAQVAALEEKLQKSPQKKTEQVRQGDLEAQVAAHTSDEHRLLLAAC